MRLASFPIPVEGETVLSTVARFIQRTPGIRHRKLNVLDLLGQAANGIVPTCLPSFTCHMPEGHPWCESPQAVALHHTLVPLYLYFAPTDRAESTLKKIVTGTSGNPSAALALAAQEFPASTKFCTECVKEDMNQRGFSVGYREHQPRFVRLCYRHDVPLRMACVNCKSGRKSYSAWRMAGACGCESPNFPSAVELGIDPKCDSGWRWVAKQVELILACKEPTPVEGRLPILRRALVEQGFVKGGGVDRRRLLEGLDDRFGARFLTDTGVYGRDGSVDIKWTGRLLNSVGEIPDFIRTLLLSALVVDDINKLPALPLSVPSAPPQPKGYGQRRARAAPDDDSTKLLELLKRKGNKLTVVALALGVSSYTLVAHLLRLRIRVPLSDQVRKRLGDEKLSKIRDSFRKGVPKVHIESQFGISEWTRMLIELDNLDLGVEHKEATIGALRDGHRATIVKYIEQNPGTSRTILGQECLVSLEWLRVYDRPWLDENLPARKPPRPKDRSKSHVDWAKRDRDCAQALRVAANAFMSSKERPKHVTRCRLLNQVGAIRAMTDNAKRYPLTRKAAAEHAESREMFEQRKLRWAMIEYKKLSVPLSVNSLRLLAGFSPVQLKVHSRLLIELAAGLNIPIHARSSFSVLRRENER